MGGVSSNESGTWQPYPPAPLNSPRDKKEHPAERLAHAGSQGGLLHTGDDVWVATFGGAGARMYTCNLHGTYLARNCEQRHFCAHGH
jgi:hypothetical protein